MLILEMYFIMQNVTFLALYAFYVNFFCRFSAKKRQ